MVFNIVRCIQCHLVMVSEAKSLDETKIISLMNASVGSSNSDITN